MNIVHIAPNAPYSDQWGFQENLLPKYHQRIGHQVTLLVTNRTRKDGKLVETQNEDFISGDGFRVVRLSHVQYRAKALTKLFSKLRVYDRLVELKPDVIFYHGLLSVTIFDVIRYKKKHRNCVILQDNHLDYNNHPEGKLENTVKGRLYRSYYRTLNRISQRFICRVYGVTPWRKQYAERYFRISPSKTDLLLMGADDEKIDFSRREEIRRQIRTENGIEETDFFIVTGGKIDHAKKIHLLMQAVAGMQDVKLLVFGTVSEELRPEFDRILQAGSNLVYIGWLTADRVYDYFLSADLICFPGGHSVLWEQACACKVPCLFARWPGMDHVNNGGNAEFLNDISVASVADKIGQLRFTEKYEQMRNVALSDATDSFLYSEIAKISLDGVNEHA